LAAQDNSDSAGRIIKVWYLSETKEVKGGAANVTRFSSLMDALAPAKPSRTVPKKLAPKPVIASL
jgi:hypothetical protein